MRVPTCLEKRSVKVNKVVGLHRGEMIIKHDQVLGGT